MGLSFIAIPIIGSVIMMILGISWEEAFLLMGPLMLIIISRYLTTKAIEEQIAEELSAKKSECPPHEWLTSDGIIKCKKCLFRVGID
jgi:MFS family permease